MSDFKSDLKNAESAGQKLYGDYQGGKGFDKQDVQQGESAGKQLYEDYSKEQKSGNGGSVTDTVKNLLGK